MPKNETFLFADSDPKPSKQPQKSLPAQKLLDWLQRWHKPTVCVGDIRIYGPKSLLTREKAVNAATVLVRNGWLTPIRLRRYDAHKWQIVRKLVVQPNVANPNN